MPRRPGTAAVRVRVRVPSKVNLFLAIRGVRTDGLHELVTVLQTVALHDAITAELDDQPSASHPAARRFMGLEFAVDGAGAVPTDGSNLAVRAARRLMEECGIGRASQTDQPHQHPVTRLRLDKKIPIAAGMAGGSADAAATLVALNQLWDAGLDRMQLATLAADLGADVPFCVSGGTAIATGTGTSTAQVLVRGSYYWVIGVSRAGLSTADVYRTFDDIGTPSAVEPDAVLQALRTADPEALGAALHNDLEVAAFHLRPELEAAKKSMIAAGAYGAVVSGSGPTVMGLAPSRLEAQRIADEVGHLFDRVELASSPAGGPEVH
ncbi:MAG: 4-(cytidine 5'-diphospho)-2-C-methyl-D-erythritol kinase [Nitriliruptoraceae bacterium]